MRKYTVICHWRGKSELEADADEIVVYAESSSAAIQKARKKWRLDVGARWPHLLLTETSILTQPASRRPV